MHLHRFLQIFFILQLYYNSCPAIFYRTNAKRQCSQFSFSGSG